MSDNFISFQPENILALIREIEQPGTGKTQTRRILKPQPPAEATSAGVIARSSEGQSDEWTWLSGDPRDADTWLPLDDFKTRFRPGDRLWVKETWHTESAWDEQRPAEIAEACLRLGYRRPWAPIEYEADERRVHWQHNYTLGKKRQARHMPRWASRLTLLVTDVQIERLQEINDAGAIAEGIEKVPYDGADPKWQGQFGWKDYTDHPHAIVPFNADRPGLSYRSLWESIHGAESWAANPWVVVIGFKPVLVNIDRLAG